MVFYRVYNLTDRRFIQHPGSDVWMDLDQAKEYVNKIIQYQESIVYHATVPKPEKIEYLILEYETPKAAYLVEGSTLRKSEAAKSIYL